MSGGEAGGLLSLRGVAVFARAARTVDGDDEGESCGLAAQLRRGRTCVEYEQVATAVLMVKWQRVVMDGSATRANSMVNF